MEGAPVPEAWAGQGVFVLAAATATASRKNIAVPGVLEEVNDRGVHLQQDELVGRRVHRHHLFYPWSAVLELRLAKDEWLTYDEWGPRPPQKPSRARLGVRLRRFFGI